MTKPDSYKIQIGEKEFKFCRNCNQELPITDFALRNRQHANGLFYRTAYCRECMRERRRRYLPTTEERAIKREIKAQKISRKNAICKNCKNYPCFRGIDTIKSNLALTCKNYIYEI